MSLRALWLTLAVALPVLGSLLAPMSTVDLTYHLRAGAEMLATGRFLAADTWTFTAAGTPWVNQQWGAQLVLHLVELAGGWVGLALFRAVLIGLIFGLVLATTRRRGLDARSAALLTLAAFVVALPALALRPQLLGLACFAVVLLLVTDRRDHPGRLWLVPVIVAVWANIHGSFFLGPLVLGLAWLEDLHDRVERPHRTLAAALVSAAAACLTPFGPWVWAYAVGMSTNPAVTARITEWQPTSLRDASGLLFFGSVLGVVALLVRRGSATPWPTIAWLAAFFVIGVYAQRGIAWWPLAAVAALAGPVVPVREDRERPVTPLLRRLNLTVVGLLAVAGVALLPTWRATDPGTGAPRGLLAHAPSSISGYLREHLEPGDRILDAQPWGSWLEYAFPNALVAIDSRIEMFPAQVWADYEAVLAGVDGWQARVAEWGVRYVVLDQPASATRDRFEADGWQAVHEADDGVVLTRP